MANTVSNRIIVLLSWSFLIIAGVANAERSSAKEHLSADLIIENVTLISPHLAQPQANNSVAISNGRITAIFQADKDNYRATQRINGSNRFLIPGLIDSHVHIRHNPLVRHGNDDQSVQLSKAYRQQLPGSFLYYGFTSIIDLDYSLSKNRWFNAIQPAPRLYHCGRGVRIAGGYGPSFVPPEIAYKIFPNLVYESNYADTWPAELNRADYTPEAAVERVVKSGAICLKTYVESGFGGIFNWPVPSVDTLQALARAAQQQSLTFIVHANGAQDWRHAIAGGAEILVHGLWHWDGDRRSVELTEQVQAALSDAISHGIAVQPTMQVLNGERATLSWAGIDDERINNVLPKTLLDYVRSAEGRWSQQQLQAIYAQHNSTKTINSLNLIDISIQRVIATTRLFVQNGGTLLFGSDTPGQDGIGNLPGLNGHLEMINWAKAGIPLKLILNAATLANARAFGLELELGTIELGKQADLLLLNSNPLEKISAYDDIVIVIVDGIAIERATLSAQQN